jgi:hypothetical protein
MPRRRTVCQDEQTKTIDDEKNRARLRKLMAALGVPDDAAEVRFTLGDKPSVSWH